MPYSIEWYIKGRVILEKAFGDVTVAELYSFNEEVTKLIADEGVAPVHVVADLTKVGRYPSLREISKTMRRNESEKMGWMIVVVENPIIRFAASVIFQLAHLRLRMYPTMQQALSYLDEVDDRLIPTDEHRKMPL